MEFVTKLSITLLIKELIIGGHKSDNQLRETENHTKCYKSREEAIKFCHEFFKQVNKALYDAKQGKGLKILTPKQLFPRFPIVLPLVKTCNTSENVLYEIRKIIYFLNREKKVTTKVYIRIMNSINL